MDSVLDAVAGQWASLWKRRRKPVASRSYRCQCERPVFFRNSACLACQTPLGFEPQRALVLPMEAGPEDGLWHLIGDDSDALYRRCGNFTTAAGCNWLVPHTPDEPDDFEGLCIACNLNRTIPDQDDAVQPGTLAPHRGGQAPAGVAADRAGPAAGLARQPGPAAGAGVRPAAPAAGRPARDDGPCQRHHHAERGRGRRRHARERAGRRCANPTARCWATSGTRWGTTTGTGWWKDTPWHGDFRAVFGDERIDYAPRCARTTSRARRPTGRCAT